MSFKEVDVVKAIPEGFHTVTPFLVPQDAPKFISFLEKAFGGDLTYIMKHGSGQVMHATVKVGDSLLMITDATDALKPKPTMLYLYVEDVDAAYKKAVKAGAISKREPLDEFYGDRSGCVEDPWGNTWWIATHVENVDEEEMTRRAKDFDKKTSKN
jgi:PhnB protein